MSDVVSIIAIAHLFKFLYLLFSTTFLLSGFCDDVPLFYCSHSRHFNYIYIVFLLWPLYFIIIQFLSKLNSHKFYNFIPFYLHSRSQLIPLLFDKFKFLHFNFSTSLVTLSYSLLAVIYIWSLNFCKLIFHNFIIITALYLLDTW